MSVLPKRVIFLTKGPLFPVVGARRLRDFQTLQILADLFPVVLCEWNPAGDQSLGIPSDFTSNYPIQHHSILPPKRALLGKIAENTKLIFQTEFDSDYAPEVEDFLNGTLQEGDAIWVSRLRMMQHLDQRIDRKYPLYLDMPQIEGDLQLDEVLAQPSLWRLAWRAYRCARYEKAQIKRAKAVFVTTDIDRARLKSQSPHVDVHVLQSALARPTLGPSPSLFATGQTRRKTILIGGDFDYLPALEGLRWFFQEVFPRLDAHFSAHQTPMPRLLVTSHNTPHLDPTEFHPLEFMEFNDRAEQKSIYENSDVIVFPMRSGRGSRIPVLEAMAHGLPIITSGRAADGIGAKPGLDYILANDPDAVATSILKCLRDSAYRKSLASSAKSYFLTDHDLEELKEAQSRSVFNVLSGGN